MLKMICLLVAGLFVLSGTLAFAQSKANVGLPWDALINGTYAAVGTAATVGGCGSAIAMKNAKGVVIDIYTTTEGASLSLGTAGVKIELKQ